MKDGSYLGSKMFIRISQVEGKTLYSIKYKGEQGEEKKKVKHFISVSFTNSCKEKLGLPTSSKNNYVILKDVVFYIFPFEKKDGTSNVNFMIDDYELIEEIDEEE